jgi:hypothetical protein
MQPLTIVLLASAVLVGSTARAHHSSSGFDTNKTITVKGTVTRYEWSNPHVYIYVQQLTDAGKVEWEVEGAPPSILRRWGWSQVTLHTGDSVTVTGSPSRNSGNRGLLPTTLARGDTPLFDRKGEVTRLAKVDPAPAVGSKGLEGTWVTLLALPLLEKLDDDPTKLPLTPEGAAALKRFDEKTMHPGARCVAMPAPMLMITPDLKHIARGEGVILIGGEFDGAQRTIHMNVTTHEGATVSTQGHSIGRWDGQSLVIDTTRFATHSIGNGYGVPSSAQKHLVERLTPSANGTSLIYHFELTDPQFLSAPVQGDVQWEFRPSEKYAPLKCNLENARRYLKD